ncbi:precorrin-3B C(17)-methyltransferase [Streptomyces zhihengii]|uniref:precorrin-3B C(17)-methyltransferase n=1 Tax=Streptomyces zhihengii TaxID=1818004 RepID=UPI00363655D2
MPLSRGAAAALSVVLLSLAAAGCADPASDPRTAGAGPAASRDGAQGYCPLPEEQRATPTPCITFDWNQRVKENHAYREPMAITEEQRAAAAPRAEALGAALKRLAATGTTEDGLRAAVGDALGLPAESVEVRGGGYDPLREIVVGGGEGKVCVNGGVDAAGAASAEVVGRTNDGTCLPGLGGH